MSINQSVISTCTEWSNYLLRDPNLFSTLWKNETVNSNNIHQTFLQFSSTNESKKSWNLMRKKRRQKKKSHYSQLKSLQVNWSQLTPWRHEVVKSGCTVDRWVVDPLGNIVTAAVGNADEGFLWDLPRKLMSIGNHVTIYIERTYYSLRARGHGTIRNYRYIFTDIWILYQVELAWSIRRVYRT